MARRKQLQSVLNDGIDHLMYRNFAVAQNWDYSDLGGLARDIHQSKILVELSESNRNENPRLQELGAFLRNLQSFQMKSRTLPKEWILRSTIAFKFYPHTTRRDHRFVYVEYKIEGDLGKIWEASGDTSFIIIEQDYLKKRSFRWNFRGRYGLKKLAVF